MRNPGGVLVSSGPDGVVERDTETCGHCNGLVVFKPGESRSDNGGICKQCMGYVCPRCYSRIGCDPFEKKLQRLEASRALRRFAGG